MDPQDEISFTVSLVETLESISRGIRLLGNGDGFSGAPGTEWGAIEGHAKVIEKAGWDISSGLGEIAQALQNIADALASQRGTSLNSKGPR